MKVIQSFHLSFITIKVSETCQLATSRIEWLNNLKKEEDEKLSHNPYKSVDPAPPALEQNVNAMKSVLLNESLPLFERYRAMFSLRNDGSEEAIKVLAEGEIFFIYVAEPEMRKHFFWSFRKVPLHI